MFGRATIRLGIGPHSSFECFYFMWINFILFYTKFYFSSAAAYHGFLSFLHISLFIRVCMLCRLIVMHMSLQPVVCNGRTVNVC